MVEEAEEKEAVEREGVAELEATAAAALEEVLEVVEKVAAEMRGDGAEAEAMEAGGDGAMEEEGSEAAVVAVLVMVMEERVAGAWVAPVQLEEVTERWKEVRAPLSLSERPPRLEALDEEVSAFVRSARRENGGGPTTTGRNSYSVPTWTKTADQFHVDLMHLSR